MNFPISNKKELFNELSSLPFINAARRAVEWLFWGVNPVNQGQPHGDASLIMRSGPAKRSASAI
jgi:glycerol-3-phosphate dehydrogenase